MKSSKNSWKIISMGGEQFHPFPQSSIRKKFKQFGLPSPLSKKNGVLRKRVQRPRISINLNYPRSSNFLTLQVSAPDSSAATAWPLRSLSALLAAPQAPPGQHLSSLRLHPPAPVRCPKQNGKFAGNEHCKMTLQDGTLLERSHIPPFTRGSSERIESTPKCVEKGDHGQLISRRLFLAACLFKKKVQWLLQSSKLGK